MKGTKKFRVKYARVVIMETTVDVEERELDEKGRPKVCLDRGLPGVFDGVEMDPLLGVMNGPHIKGIVDYDAIYEETEEVE